MHRVFDQALIKSGLDLMGNPVEKVFGKREWEKLFFQRS